MRDGSGDVECKYGAVRVEVSCCLRLAQARDLRKWKKSQYEG